MLKFAEYSLIDPLQEQRRATSQSSTHQPGQPQAASSSALQFPAPSAPPSPHLARSPLSAKYSYKAGGTKHRECETFSSEMEQQLANAGENHKPAPALLRPARPG